MYPVKHSHRHNHDAIYTNRNLDAGSKDMIGHR